jgi:hypothetical protein
MTTFTKAELAERLLKDLGLLGAEESPMSADLTWAEETVSSEIDLLAAKGIPVWNGSEDSIPNEYLTALSRRIGIAIAPSYGLTDPATAQMAMAAAEKALVELAAKPATGSVAEADYF